MATFEGLVIDAIEAAVASNEPGIESALTSFEGDAETAIANALNSFKASNPLLQSLIVGPLEAAVISYLVTKEKQYPGTVLVPLVLSYIQGLAPKVGG